MPKEPPKQAVLFSFTTGQPIDDPPELLQAFDLLSRIASRAMVHGADPSALVSVDHNLILCSDSVIMQIRRCAALEHRLLALPIGSPERDKIAAERKSANITISKLLLKIATLRAETPAGLFAKASAVTRSGMQAVRVGQSLARDLLASPDLRRAIWPPADEK
jgi:hypothetical protein